MNNKVRDTRLKNGLTLRDLGKMTGISLGLLSGIENHKHIPNVDKAQRIAAALETTVEDLFPSGVKRTA